MSTKHTPGPWRVGDAGASVFGPKDLPVTVAKLVHPNSANARLIAAAPELLDALMQLLQAFEADKNIAPKMTIKTSFETNGQTINKALAAIAKATQS